MASSTPSTSARYEAAVAELPRAAVQVGDPVVNILVASGLVASKGAARRAVAEGGAYVNNVKVTGEDATLGANDLLHGRFALLRRGKKTLGGRHRLIRRARDRRGRAASSGPAPPASGPARVARSGFGTPAERV